MTRTDLVLPRSITDAVTSSAATELLLFLASVVGAVTVVGGAVWWLIAPRVRAWAGSLVREVTGVRQQLDTDQPDTVARHAKVAARAAAELPAIRDQLDGLADDLAGLQDWRAETDRRLGNVESALIALLGPELRRRLFGTEPQHHHVHIDRPNQEDQ